MLSLIVCLKFGMTQDDADKNHIPLLSDLWRRQPVFAACSPMPARSVNNTFHNC